MGDTIQAASKAQNEAPAGAADAAGTAVPAPPVPAAPAAGVSGERSAGTNPGAAAGPEVRRAHFQPLQTETGAAAGALDNIALLMDVVVTMTVQLGGTAVPLREVLKLGPGSVVRLDRVLGEPVDILINRELVGRGEVVVVEDRFGVRVTELADPKLRKEKA